MRQPVPLDGLPCEPVALFVPVKGRDPELEQNLKSLFLQEYPDYEVVFVVESSRDPAVPVIQRLMREMTTVPARLIVSGEAKRGGQKVHNLLVATEQLDPRTRILAFADSDLRPPTRWLKSLVCRLYEERMGAATSYPLSVPQTRTLPNLILYSIVSSVIGMCGRHGFHKISGASCAIRREVFEACRIREAWQGTLSDDLVMTRAVQRARLRIEFEHSCICPSPVNVRWSQMLEYVRRQFIICRHYCPRLWWTSFLACSVMQFAFWGNLLLACVLLVTGQSNWHWPLTLAAAAYCGSVGRGWLRQRALLSRFPNLARRLVWCRRFDIWAAPLVGLVTWTQLCISVFRRTIVWRGIRYKIDSNGQATALARLPSCRHEMRGNRAAA